MTCLLGGHKDSLTNSIDRKSDLQAICFLRTVTYNLDAGCELMHQRYRYRNGR